MNYYNLYIETYNDILTSFQTSEDDIMRVVDAYDNGNDDVFINGIRYSLKDLKIIKVFDFNEPWAKLNDYLNSSEAKQFHEISRNGKLALATPGLAKKGKDLTREFFKNDFGWKKKISFINDISKNQSMLTVDINFIPESREFLQKFVNSNYKKFSDDIGKYQPNKGYGQFPNSFNIVRCMRKIARALGDDFRNLSIPEKFSSPTDLISQAKEFIDHLKAFDSDFIEAINILEKNNKVIPAPICEIDKNRKKTIDVFKMFVQLAEKEFSNTGQVTLSNSQTAIEKIENLLQTFHDVATQISQRRNENGVPRPSLKINDEYDVQDLLRGLLRIYFSDIRAEEWIPSYAGSSKRSDFLLKDEKIIIEVKDAAKS